MSCCLSLQSLPIVGLFILWPGCKSAGKFRSQKDLSGQCLSDQRLCLYRKDFEMSQLNSRIEDGQVMEAQLQKKIKEVQVWWEGLFLHPGSPECPSDVMCRGICVSQSLSEHRGISLEKAGMGSRSQALCQNMVG